MSFYIIRENYNKSFASSQYQIAHDHPDTDYPDRNRQSFFRINDEEELQAACKNWSHFPCLVMVGLTGGLLDKGGSIRQGNINTLMFLTQVKLNPEAPVIADAISIAYDTTFSILEDYVASLTEDAEDGCGTFKNLELGRLHWEQTGPIEDGLYGWILTFPDETRTQMLTKNPAHFL